MALPRAGVLLRWQPFRPAEGVTYNVYRSPTAPVPTDDAHRIASGLRLGFYLDRSGRAGMYYVVTAQNETGESGPSNTARARPLWPWPPKPPRPWEMPEGREPGGSLPPDPLLLLPAPLAPPQPGPFVSPPAPPESSRRTGGPLRAGLLLPDPLLLLLAPLALGSVAWRKKDWRWAAPLAGVLLVVAVVAIGASLAGPAAAWVGPQPFLSPQSPPPGWEECASPNAVEGGRAIAYAYDPLGRLVEAAYSTGECYQYRYDAVGNRTQMLVPDGEHVYTYDAADRLTSVDGVAYTWDERGNQTSNGTLTTAYDMANRLVGVSGSGVEVAYGYNGDGLRVWRAANGQTTHYTWDLAAGLPQLLGDGETLYVPGVGQYRDGEWVYTLMDGLGSVRQLADGQGYIVQQYDYSPFGRVVAAEGEWANPLQYTGEQWDADVGLLYLRARWYDPATGRFLTRDPFPGYAALPQTQHPYGYVGNNPVNLTDPGGEITPIIVAAGLGAAIGAVGGGVSYVLAHPGGRPEDYLRSGGFWRSVGVGAASGAVAGAVGWLVPSLLPASGFWGSVGVGALSGALASGAPSQPASRAASHHSACPLSLQLKPWEWAHSLSLAGRLRQSSG